MTHREVPDTPPPRVMQLTPGSVQSITVLPEPTSLEEVALPNFQRSLDGLKHPALGINNKLTE